MKGHTTEPQSRFLGWLAYKLLSWSFFSLRSNSDRNTEIGIGRSAVLGVVQPSYLRIMVHSKQLEIVQPIEHGHRRDGCPQQQADDSKQLDSELFRATLVIVKSVNVVCIVYVCVYVCVLQSSGISPPIEIGFTLQVNAITTTNPLSKISAHLGAYSWSENGLAKNLIMYELAC